METKYVAKQSIHVDLGYIKDASKPILSLALDVYEAQCAEMHSHPRGQLLYSSRGTMKVELKDSLWLVTPHQAVWVPSRVEHQVFFLKENHIRNLFIDEGFAQQLPNSCFGFEVSPFLRELILKATHVGNDYAAQGPAIRLMAVLLDELATIQPTQMALPISKDTRLAKIIEVLIADPSDARTLREFADEACLTERTLARLFVKELGLSFGTWRKQVKLLAALAMLGKGHTVSQVAYELGYNSPSAFIEMFRKSLGKPPSRYLER